ncbi:hypothetical protein RJ639_047681 [Escallonia herrerae]|uniref:Condensin-2 complex subunit G2 n=1 Tax=Escallonia herrerae TaxID=1293975 RepID=A0AA88W7L9_9ASTE|nr:hypothetical protein RJ639_047681 [Escallonia herrerae]
MEKRLRSSLHTSAEDFLTSAAKLGLRSAKPSLKALIHRLTPSAALSSSLPLHLHRSISHYIAQFKHHSTSTTSVPTQSPPSPPTKRLRRSSRHSKTTASKNSAASDHENAKKTVTESLQVYAYVALMCVLHPKKAFSPADLLPAVSELHDNLILFESDSILLSEIANLCEEWWKEELPGREALISQTLPFLLSRSLTLKKKVDVHRVYALREAFNRFDFEDDSIEDLKLLLIRCVISPLYLKTEDGRRFVAFMFGLSGQLVKEALAMIRSQIPFGRRSMLEAYAEIVFRAWKAVDEGSRGEIVDGFLQGLVDSAIHASSRLFAASIRRVLGGFINQRTTDGVEKLLFRLAEPVIFRSLQVANSNVRQNALHLLLDLFPLEDPDSTKEVKDTLLDKQFFLLEKLLMDECPDVRVVAVEGSCRILHLFWEIIPSSTITKLITKILDDMAHDVSNEVRLSTVNGIIYLLGNPQSHDILKVLLPRLGHLILDSALFVRVAAIDLLLLLRDIRTFQFHKVVSLDVLLTTLATDQPLVARKITKLIIPSYFPSKVSPEEACSRCVTLIKRSPIAGARFCEFALSEGASLQALMELFRVFISLALSPDKLESNQIDALLVAAAYLCKDLVSDASYKTALKKELSGDKMKCLFVAAATGRAQSSVCNIVSLISPDAVDGLLEECMGLVTNCSGLSDNMERQAEVRSAHTMMLSCDWFSSMLEALTKLLQNTAYGCHTQFGTEMPKYDIPPKKQRKTRSAIKISGKRKTASGKKFSNSSTSRFEEDYAIATGIAWQIKDLLISEDMRKSMLGSEVLDYAFFALKVISEVSIVQCLQCDYMSNSPVSAYTALTLHISCNNITLNRSEKKDSVDSSKSYLDHNLVDQTIDHLLNCTNKLLEAGDTIMSGKPSDPRDSYTCGMNRASQTNASSSSDGGSTFAKERRLSNLVKMLTAVLKFIVDSTMMDLASSNRERCLKFTLDYMEFIISNVRRHTYDPLQLKEEDMKETFLCLKSSFTYAAKLLNLVLSSSSEASSPPPDAYNLANHLLDLILFSEECLGSGYAARLIAAAKPWLPDLVLALGSWYIPKQTSGKKACSTASDTDESSFPSWPLILAKIELCELRDIGSDEESNRVTKSEEFSAFKTLLGMMIQLLRANHIVLDAVGVFLLSGSAVGLEKKDFELVLGLLHFICVKLVRHENREWGQLNLMLECLQEIYPQIKTEADALENCEEGKQKLQSAIALLQPVWMCYISETGRDAMEEE